MIRKSLKVMTKKILPMTVLMMFLNGVQEPVKATCKRLTSFVKMKKSMGAVNG